MTLFELMNGIIAAVVLARAINLVNHMNSKTSHLLRIAVVMLVVASFGMVAAPFFLDVPQWLHTMFVLSVALYVHADRRIPLERRTPPDRRTPHHGVKFG